MKFIIAILCIFSIHSFASENDYRSNAHGHITKLSEHSYKFSSSAGFMSIYMTDNNVTYTFYDESSRTLDFKNERVIDVSKPTSDGGEFPMPGGSGTSGRTNSYQMNSNYNPYWDITNNNRRVYNDLIDYYNYESSLTPPKNTKKRALSFEMNTSAGDACETERAEYNFGFNTYSNLNQCIAVEDHTLMLTAVSVAAGCLVPQTTLFTCGATITAHGIAIESKTRAVRQCNSSKNSAKLALNACQVANNQDLSEDSSVNGGTGLGIDNSSGSVGGGGGGGGGGGSIRCTGVTDVYTNGVYTGSYCDTYNYVQVR